MPAPPFDGTIWDNGDQSGSATAGVWGHRTFNSASCGNVSVGYTYRLPNTWSSEPGRKFPIIYFSCGGADENWLIVGFEASNGGAQTLGDIDAMLNWGAAAHCILVNFNPTIDGVTGVDALAGSPMDGVIMMQQQMRELIDDAESFFSARCVPQGWSDANGWKGRGIMGVSGGGNAAWRLALLNPTKYVAMYEFASAVAGDHSPWPSFPSDTQMFNATQAGQDAWVTWLPQNLIPAQASAVNATNLYIHGQCCTGDTGNITNNINHFNALAANGYAHDALEQPVQPYHSARAYFTQPLPWFVGKCQPHLKPVQNPGSYSTGVNTALPIAEAALRVNDTDPQLLALSVTSVGSAVNGAVVLSGGVVTFTPTTNFTGDASFDYTVTNTDGLTNNATVAVTVGPVSTAGAGDASGTGVARAVGSGNAATSHLLDNSGNILTDDGVVASATFGDQLTNEVPGGGVTADTYWVAEGDSRTAADGLHVPVNQMYPELWVAGHPTIVLNNVAISGSFLSDGPGGTDPGAIIVRGPSVDALIAANPGYTHYILSVWIGANDSHLGPAMVAGTTTYMAELAQYCDDRRAAGWKLVLCTEIAEFDVSNTPNYSNWVDFRSIFNPLVRTWLISHVDAIADFDSDTPMGPAASAADLTLYSDTIHPTVYGQSLLPEIMGAALEAALGGPTTDAGVGDASGIGSAVGIAGGPSIGAGAASGTGAATGNGATVQPPHKFLLDAIWDGTQLIDRLDGGVKVRTDTSVSSPNLFAANKYAIGSEVNQTNEDAHVWLYELVVIKGTLLNVNRDKLEGYLAWKHNVAGNLLPTHPYALNRPRVDSNAVGTTAGASTAASTGSASETGSALAVGATTVARVGAASGIGSAAAVGTIVPVFHTGVGAATGIGAEASVGAATASGAGSTAGLGATAAKGASTAASIGSASGIGTATCAQSGISTGASSGTGSAAATGASTAAGVGTASGLGAGIVTDVAIKATVGASSGTGTGAATGATIVASVGAASGLGATLAHSATQGQSFGDASGAGTATATGFSISASVGTASGTGSAAAIGAATPARVGAASGIGTASASATALKPATAAASGIGTASASATAIKETIGAASGTSTASATGLTFAASVGAASGTGTSSSAITALKPTVGAASGTGTASAVGTKVLSSVGAASGTSTAPASGSTVKETQGVASGVATAAASGSTSNTSVSAAVGLGTATARATAIISAVGIAVGTSTAQGFTTANASGIAVGVGAAHSAGFGLIPSPADPDRIVYVPGELRIATVVDL